MILRHLSPLRLAALFALGAVALAACARVPVTGRRQYNLIPDQIMVSIGKSNWVETLKASKVERSGPDAERIKKIGRRISAVADRPDYDWKVALFDDRQINAWCLPGGYIGFYTGILPVATNEAGAAFVMGHEVAHATARHGAERLSQQLTLLGGLAGLAVLIDQKTEMNREQQAIVLGALGLGAEVGLMLPFSRSHESEADIIGMMYAAGAGYPPAEGIKMWDRMEKASGGSGVPAFLSTHPSNDKRQENMRAWLPRAKKRFERNKLAEDTLAKVW